MIERTKKNKETKKKLSAQDRQEMLDEYNDHMGAILAQSGYKAVINAYGERSHVSIVGTAQIVEGLASISRIHT